MAENEHQVVAHGTSNGYRTAGFYSAIVDALGEEGCSADFLFYSSGDERSM
jgi:hypothetical protein